MYKAIAIPNRLLTGAEVATILNVSKTFAYRMMREGQIPTVRLGNKGKAVSVKPHDLLQYIDTNLTGGNLLYSPLLTVQSTITIEDAD